MKRIGLDLNHLHLITDVCLGQAPWSLKARASPSVKWEQKQ